MKIIRVTYCTLAALLSVASCSKEATEPAVVDWSDGDIYFKPTFSDVSSSRAQDMTLDRLESFQVTCFNTDNADNDDDGIIAPYFKETTFFRTGNPAFGIYVSAPPIDWPATYRHMRFVAFSPSIRDMRGGNAYLEGLAIDEADSYFKIVNGTTETSSRNNDQSPVDVKYRLEKIRINPDISKQFDFVTADASGDRMMDLMRGVDLAFSHRLSQVELKAWGDNEDFNFDIAGVRIGNPVVEGTFVFADDDNPDNAGGWTSSENAVKDRIDYIYQVGDTIFRINRTEHYTQESSGSIMGVGGCAMVIPTINEKWEGLDDPNIGNQPYTTDKMYFSILMRVTSANTGATVYPYSRNRNGMTVISYAVNNSGIIKTRLFSGEIQGTYFTDPELRNEYVPEEGVEIMDFGWAAIPVDADWIAGKKYVYTLNYSEGIGQHDPSEPEPGKIIKANRSMVSVSVEVSEWTEGSLTDVIVPRK